MKTPNSSLIVCPLLEIHRNIWKVVFIAGGCDLISKHGTNIHPNSQGRESDILDIFGMLEDV